jgi:methionine sulfoxide reductase heme-binding subunit
MLHSSTALWYASRATGIVALGLLTAAMVLGVTVQRRGRVPGLPRFGVTSLHRSVSLLAIIFVAIHVITAIADPYVSIGIAAIVVPFVSHYEPFWLGLGAVAFDLMIALIATSLIRVRLGRRAWRSVHWLAYATWPVAFVHGIGAATDMRSGLLLAFVIGSAVVVAVAVTWRLTRRSGQHVVAGPVEPAQVVAGDLVNANGGGW